MNSAKTYALCPSKIFQKINFHPDDAEPKVEKKKIQKKKDKMVKSKYFELLFILEITLH